MYKVYGVLSDIQAYSALGFSVFLATHATQVALANVGVDLANNWLLLGRPLYQDRLIENVVVIGGVTAHVAAGVAKACMRRPKYQVVDLEGDLTRYAVVESDEALRLAEEGRVNTVISRGVRKRVSMLLPGHRMVGYMLVPVLLGHYIITRAAPLRYFGDSAFLDFSYISLGLQTHPRLFGGLQVALVGLGMYHVCSGAATVWKRISGGRSRATSSIKRSYRLLHGVQYAAFVSLTSLLLGGLYMMGKQRKIPLRSRPSSPDRELKNPLERHASGSSFTSLLPLPKMTMSNPKSEPSSEVSVDSSDTGAGDSHSTTSHTISFGTSHATDPLPLPASSTGSVVKELSLDNSDDIHEPEWTRPDDSRTDVNDIKVDVYGVGRRPSLMDQQSITGSDYSEIAPFDYAPHSPLNTSKQEKLPDSMPASPLPPGTPRGKKEKKSLFPFRRKKSKDTEEDDYYREIPRSFPRKLSDDAVSQTSPLDLAANSNRVPPSSPTPDPGKRKLNRAYTSSAAASPPQINNYMDYCAPVSSSSFQSSGRGRFFRHDLSDDRSHSPSSVFEFDEDSQARSLRNMSSRTTERVKQGDLKRSAPTSPLEIDTYSDHMEGIINSNADPQLDQSRANRALSSSFFDDSSSFLVDPTSKKMDREVSESSFMDLSQLQEHQKRLHESAQNSMRAANEVDKASVSQQTLSLPLPAHGTAAWSPPESWAVQPVGYLGPLGPAELRKEPQDSQIEESKFDYNLNMQDYTIRIFRPDTTFTTLSCPLSTSTADIIQILAKKYFLQDTTRYNLYIKYHETERALMPTERPLLMQRILLEQMGYTDVDRLEDLGREDNSYLVRFTFRPAAARTVPTEEEVDFGNYEHVDLQLRNLRTIPIFLYNQANVIESLNVSRNWFIALPMDFVQLCSSLRELTLCFNDFSQIPASIHYITTLERLNIANNKVKELDHAHLEELPNLRSLEVSNNQLKDLPKGFADMKNLRFLGIANNYFTEFPEILCEVPSLEDLDISFNKISSLPYETSKMKSLRSFRAVANELAGELPASWSELKNLREVDIRQNAINSLTTLSAVSSLQKLTCDYNAISVVQTEFPSLRTLKASKNHLTQFKLSPPNVPSIAGFPSLTGSVLTNLNLSGCKLSTLSDELLATATAIEALILDNNFLTAIPKTISHLHKLRKLSVQNNELADIPFEIAYLADLRILDLQQNNLKALPKEIWLCPALQSLNCSSNLLTAFPKPISAIGVQLSTSGVFSEYQTAIPTEAFPETGLGANSGQGIIDMETVTPESEAATKVDSFLTFNPPSFFSSPRNHPPPITLTLRNLALGDNRLTDEVFGPLSLFSELRSLNLSFNDMYEIPPEGLCHHHLHELYLSGNHLSSLPADDIEKLSHLRVLHLNGNKLQTLPAELGKLRKLQVLDVGSNMLKYNIANWPYDWNWNWNLTLKYLNFSGNKRFEIKQSHNDLNGPRDRNVSDFSALRKLRVLGLMDVTILVSPPDEVVDRRIRTSPSEVNSLAYGIADWLGFHDQLTSWDLVVPRFRGRDDECLFGLFDGKSGVKDGNPVNAFLNTYLSSHLHTELQKLKHDETVVAALRRTFLGLERDLGFSDIASINVGASAVVCYIAGKTLYAANIGDALAVLSRDGGSAVEISQKHIALNPSETSRIRQAGGYVSTTGLLNDELAVSRNFGHFHLNPVLNANPYISMIELSEQDEFVILANRGLWDRVSYQQAVDICVSEKDDLLFAAQKLRDFAITYGADDSIMVMVIGVGDIFDNNRRLRIARGGSGGNRIAFGNEISMDDMNSGLVLSKKVRRGKDEMPGDSTLARLPREVAPPVGQVAICFTDIKNSTFLWETQPIAMRSAIKTHNSLLRRQLRSVGGYEVKTEGDAFMVCFSSVTSALLWCFTVQLQLLEADWPTEILESEDGRPIVVDGRVLYRGLSVRMGVHWGSPVWEIDPITKRMDYFGPVVNRASRVCSAADGGQICVSSDVVMSLKKHHGLYEKTVDDVGDDISGRTARDVLSLRKLGFSVREIGERKLKGLETAEMLSMVLPKQLTQRWELDKSKFVASVPNTTGLIAPASEADHSIKVDQHPHRIDAALVRTVGRLCLRLEYLASGQAQNGSSQSLEYLISLMDTHVRDDADEQDLYRILENIITRIENATSSLYLSRMGGFANVLEKLSTAVELDPTYILKALQIYVQALSEPVIA